MFWDVCTLFLTTHSRYSSDFLKEYLTQNVIFHVKSRIAKHEFWGLLILKSQHPMLPNLTWNETWNDASLKKWGDCLIVGQTKQKKIFAQIGLYLGLQGVINYLLACIHTQHFIYG